MLSPQSSRYRSQYHAQFRQLSSLSGEEFSVPLDLIRTRLRSERDKLQLRDDQIEVLLREADKNGDERLTFDEFQALITSKEAQSSQVKRALYLIADQVITPRQRIEVHSYIDEYNCCPPPLFIFLISIIEVSKAIIACVFMVPRSCPLGNVRGLVHLCLLSLRILKTF
ncbi:unnamed protein product [Heligmosomoides polygyrus]|uniref:EF-hand domain-containing protein n=1 Tax=Heligmosomoides polygyrus TaxID=6339 RepID=A0A183G1C1_HELPZ|nr:unnamed protein product [Heligmosomoides polygyrus]